MSVDFHYKIDNENPDNKKRFIRSMFDSIVPTYDLLNRLLSMGIDRLWRRKVRRLIGPKSTDLVIDLCCGTGDLSKLLHKRCTVVSLDFSFKMIQKGIKKKRILDHPITADACNIPFKDNSFNSATIAFGIRNIPDINIFLTGIHRALKPGGMLAILELSRPSNSFIKFFYTFYLNKVIPFFGGIISGKRKAYMYLAKTITTFIDYNELTGLLKSHGFNNVQAHPRTFGIATIITAHKEIK